MIDLPLDIIINIINFLSFEEVNKLMRLFNHKIFEACRYLKTIKLDLKYRDAKKINIISLFYQPENLIVRNGSSDKNLFCYISLKNNWKLKKIIYNNCRVVDSDVMYEFLKSQTKLEKLELYLCISLQQKHLTVINKNIKELALINNLFRFKDIKYLTNFKKLVKLDLSYSRYLFDTNIHELQFKNLKKLYLANTQLSLDDRFFIFLENLTKLEELNLDFVITTYQKFHKINKTCPNIKKLSLINSINMVFDNNPAPLLQKKWNNINDLTLSYSLIDDDNIIDIVDNIPNIKSLNINQTKVTDVGVVYITLILKNIERLFISTNSISNISANHIAIYLNNLIELDISHTIITNYYAKKIIKSNNNIERLCIIDCPNIDHRIHRYGVKKINI